MFRHNAGNSSPGEIDWELLLRNAGQRLYRIAARITHRAELAEEICQEALLKAIEHKATIRDRQAMEGWLIRVVVNESFRTIRRHKTETKALVAHQQSQEARSNKDDPASRFANREDVMSALEQLPELTRTVVVLRTQHSMSGNDVARLLDCSAVQVSRHLHTGLAQLRQSLDGNGAPRRDGSV